MPEEYDADKDNADNAEHPESRRLEFNIEGSESENQENARDGGDGACNFLAGVRLDFAFAFDSKLCFKVFAALECASRKAEFFGFLVGHGQEFAFFHENLGRAPELLFGAVHDGEFFAFDNESRVALCRQVLIECGGEFEYLEFRRHKRGGEELWVVVALGEVSELRAERGLDLFTDDLRSAVATLHNRGAVANGCGFEHVEALAG